jgi:DNA helicase-2/ATP-dependent DNA helicase PcrA
MQISTIHSFCYHVLLDNLGFTSYKKLEVVSDSYVQAIIINLAPKFGLTIKKSDARKILKSFIDYKMGEIDHLQATHKLIYNELGSILKEGGKITFLEILLLARDLLTNQESVRKKYAIYKHIMIDECQDTNPLQFDIIDKLIKDDTNVLVIGDAKQNIYGFRGCSYHYMNDFAKKLDAKVYTLSETFRFGKPIAELSNLVVNNMESLEEIYKKDTTTNINITKKPVFKFHDLSTSSKEIALDINIKRQSGIPLKDLTVLYRCNKDSLQLQKELTKLGIPHVTKSGSFLDRREIKFIINLYRLCDNFDLARMLDIVKEYNNQINSVVLSKAYQATQDNENTLEVLNTGFTKYIEGIGQKRKDAFESLYFKFVEGINRLKKVKYNTIFLDFCNIFEIKETSFMDDDANKSSFSSPEERLDFINSFQEMYNDFIKKFPEKTFEEFVEKMKVDYAEDPNEDENKNLVNLMTIHSSKGMTLPYTYILGHNIANEFFYKQIKDPEERKQNILEEKFLLYVALTRVSKELQFYYDDPSKFEFNFIFPKDLVEEEAEKNEVGDVNIGLTVHEINMFKRNLNWRKFLSLKGFPVLKKTEKALMFNINHKNHWFPKSHIGYDMGILLATEWILNKNGVEL